MHKIYPLLLNFLLAFSIVRCDITNLNDFFTVFNQNSSIVRPVGFLTQANFDAVKRYLPANINITMFKDKVELLKAIENETIIAGITTGISAEDLGPKYHIFTSLIISPQAMLVAPDFNNKSTPYGLKNTSSDDLFDALNAAIAAMQHEDTDETLITKNTVTNAARVFSCRQETQLTVPNRNETSGYLRDILFNTKTLLIGGVGPYDWGVHDGNYKVTPTTGFYPQLLDAIVKKFGQLKGPDGINYGDDITYNRTYFENSTLLFRALLDGTIHATDVYVLIDAPYTGTGESCSNDSQCRARESCNNNICSHPLKSRSLHFRTTCTTSSRDSKFITKKDSSFLSVNQTSTTRETPKTRWIGYILIFAALFGSIFVGLTMLVRRKRYYRVEHTLQGGFGKFARLQEESEPPIESMDAFDDHIVQSPRDNTNTTS